MKFSNLSIICKNIRQIFMIEKVLLHNLYKLYKFGPSKVCAEKTFLYI